MPQIKAVIFDLDDTLYDCTGQLVDAGRRRVARAFVTAGVSLTEKELFDLQIAIFNDYGGKVDVFEHIIEQFQLPHKEELKKNILKEYNNTTISHITPFPEALPLLKKLQEQGVKTGILTTGLYSRQMKKIELLGLKEYVDEIVVHDIELGGTKKESLKYLLSKLRVKPENALSVGDKIYSEIKVSNILGMHTVQLVHGRFKDMKPKLATEFPDFKIKKLDEIMVIIKRIAAGKKGLPSIVLIGGGSGTARILKGLKNYTPNLTGIVSVTDTGRTTGMVRRELGVSGTGDIRNCLVALSDESTLRDLFDYRFESGQLKGFSFGNLFLASLAKTTGSFQKALAETRKILKIKGQVLPATLDSVHLCVELEDGTIIEQENNIVSREKIHSGRSPIRRAFLKPQDVSALPEAVRAIKNADLIVFNPGGLFSSLISNLLVPGIRRAILESPAKKVYICNIMTQQGQTDNYPASFHVKQVENYLQPGIFDYAIFNNAIPENIFLEAYAKEKAFLVQNDHENIKQLSLTPIFADVIQKDPEKKEGNNRLEYLRHDPEKIGKVIISLL